MGRILFFIVLAFLVWLVVRMLGGSRKRDDPVPPVEQAPAARAIESITQCAWCGVHVPAGQSLAVPDGRIYCCEAHREAALGTTTDRTRS